jgi:hypothetical protein
MQAFSFFLGHSLSTCGVQGSGLSTGRDVQMLEDSACGAGCATQWERHTPPPVFVAQQEE